MQNTRLKALLALMLFAAAEVAAVGGGSTVMRDIVCSVIDAVWITVSAIGPALVIVMFTYGGIKYVFSADDPGGRKQGKMTCIHAIIGAIILVLATYIMDIVGGLTDPFISCLTPPGLP